MTAKLFRVAVFAAIGAFLFIGASTKAFAAEYYVGTAVSLTPAGTQADPFETFDDAFAAAADGDTIIFDGTTEVITTGTTINKILTIKGINGGAIETSGATKIFTITADGVTIQDLAINKTDKTGQNVIGIQSNNVTVSGNTFNGQYVIGDGDVSRALEVSSVTGVNITGNTITGFRQPAYINDNATGSVTNNSVNGTKGWVIVANADLTITGNQGSGNTVDFAFIAGTPNNYTDLVALSAANNDVLIINKASTPTQLNRVYVEAGAVATPEYDTGTMQSPYSTLADGFAATATGGELFVKAGSYAENLTINKPITMMGPNAGIVGTGSRIPEASITGAILVTSSDVSFSGFTVTNPSYSGSSVKGIHLYSDSTVKGNILVENNIFQSIANGNTKGSYGIMVQGVLDGIKILGNKVDTITSAGWARGIEVTPTCASATVPLNVVISGNSISNVTSGTGDAFLLTIDWCSSTQVIANAAHVSLTNNSFSSPLIRNLDGRNLNAQSN